MQFEMFEMLRFIDSNVTNVSEFYKTLPDMTETDVRKVYLQLKSTKKQTNSSSCKEYQLPCPI